MNEKPEQEKDWAALFEDVKIIKGILQNEDTPLPRLWVATWIVAPAVALAGLLQYFVPFFRDLDFDGRLLWLWVPGFCLIFPLILLFLHREIRHTGKGFLGQGRIRHLLFARFVIPPAALVLVWLLSRGFTPSLEGAILLVISIWVTAIEQMFPPQFRLIPFGYLTLGLIELGFRFTGPEVTLLNVLIVSSTIAFAGFLFWSQRTAPSQAPEGNHV